MSPESLLVSLLTYIGFPSGEAAALALLPLTAGLALVLLLLTPPIMDVQQGACDLFYYSEQSPRMRLSSLMCNRERPNSFNSSPAAGCHTHIPRTHPDRCWLGTVGVDIATCCSYAGLALPDVELRFFSVRACRTTASLLYLLQEKGIISCL